MMQTSIEEGYLPLTELCQHYEHVSEVPWDIQKYWHQRYSIFSRYDEGIYMTDDAWFGVTPEPVATHVASDLSQNTSPSRTTIIDLFAGAGGNTIAFALSGRWKKIIAIERDASVLACAQNNAYIYGVYDKITWVNDDCFSYMSKNAAINHIETVIFASPPWGGPGYSTDEIFNLATMQPYSLKQIHDMCKMMDSALFLPRTSDLRQIAKRAPPGKKIDVVQYCMEGASKALVAYIPATDTG
jgi:trimethylguanosine synthase